MDRIINELKSADKSTKEALKSIEDASEKIQNQYHVTNNIFTEGGSLTIERLGEAVHNKTIESNLLKDVIKHLEDIISVKDAQIKLMLNTLTDNKNEIDELKKRIKLMERNNSQT